jgi:multicomponent K+:H+ antiporter subunit D
LIIGMPPLSGFIGKLSLISALLNPLGLGGDAPIPAAGPGGAADPLGLASLIAFARLGIQRFWTPKNGPRHCCAAMSACRSSCCSA